MLMFPTSLLLLRKYIPAKLKQWFGYFYTFTSIFNILLVNYATFVLIMQSENYSLLILEATFLHENTSQIEFSEKNT